jgi:hypothetical protein
LNCAIILFNLSALFEDLIAFFNILSDLLLNSITLFEISFVPPAPSFAALATSAIIFINSLIDNLN